MEKLTMQSNNIFLETPRLYIRIPSFDDFDELCHLNSNAEVMRYMDPNTIGQPEKVRHLLARAIEHYQKHGFTFGVVIEKSSGKCVGQAGIFYLAFEDNQPDIEIGYRLYPDYWKKGYATELAFALVKWGFKHLTVDKLVAVIHPENEKSRRVLEKIGMCYIGKKHAYHTEVAEYQLLKNTIDHSKIRLVAATLDQLPIIENLARFYAYDISEYYGHEPGWEVEDNGMYSCSVDFKQYFTDKNTYPWLIFYDDEIAGFAIVNTIGSDKTIDFNMAQFFILRKFKNKGVGKYVAYQCFNRFKGVWEVMVMPGNEGAYRFWRTIIRQFTCDDVLEYTRQVAHFRNATRNFFRFNSDKS